MKSRRQFIVEFGGTCANWTWSWSFVNHTKGWVIFGAWDQDKTPDRQVILNDNWEFRGGRKAPGYSQSLRHIELINKGYALFTFPMRRGLAHPGTGKDTSKIEHFEPLLEQRLLRRDMDDWLAVSITSENGDSGSNDGGKSNFLEGSKKCIVVNTYERDPRARASCLAHHGFNCAVCETHLAKKYGEIAQNFIHVHHLIRVSEMGENYEVNPKNDMVPVCPNCHSIIHRRNPMYSIEELRFAIEREMTNEGHMT